MFRYEQDQLAEAAGSFDRTVGRHCLDTGKINGTLTEAVGDFATVEHVSNHKLAFLTEGIGTMQVTVLDSEFVRMGIVMEMDLTAMFLSQSVQKEHDTANDNNGCPKDAFVQFQRQWHQIADQEERTDTGASEPKQRDLTDQTENAEYQQETGPKDIPEGTIPIKYFGE